VPRQPSQHDDSILRRLPQTIRRAFAEFLKIPALIILAFLALAAAATALDYAYAGPGHPLHTALREYFFRNGQATSDLLATIAGSIITVLSITFSMLLLAVQQAAGALTHQVYDQFLRRRINQIYFGFFVGLAVYTLVILATVDQPYNPVFGATVALVLTLVALVLVIVLLYTTVNQMRPVVVIEKIHDHALRARERQLAWLRRVRPVAQSSGQFESPVTAAVHGYIVRIDVDALGAAAKAADGEVEFLLRVPIGASVAFQDEIATIRADRAADFTQLADCVRAAVHIEQQRDLDADPAYGIEQLAIIAWTSISTAKSNPSPGLLVLHSLRDLLARWSAEPAEPSPSTVERVPVVYVDDVMMRLFDAFETLAVVASESMQPQTAAEFVRTFATMFHRLPAEHQSRAEDLIRRSLSALGDHVLTAELDAAFHELVAALNVAGRTGAATEVEAARHSLAATIGKLRSRSTRAPADP
jgi:uncharacterized membrane protein